MNKKLVIDIATFVVVGVVTFLLAGHFDVLEALLEFSAEHEEWEVDEIFPTAIVLMFVLLVIVIKRERELRVEVERRMLAEKVVSELAYQDALTGLPNIRFFMPALKDAIKQTVSGDNLQAVLFIDVDNFKEVNDTYGHTVGDRSLIHLSEILEQYVEQENLIARIAGDEFVILLKNIAGPEEAAAVARNIIDDTSKPFFAGQDKLNLSLSIGIAITPHDSSSAEELMRFADEAMYEVKRQGKNSYHFFRQELNVVEGVKLNKPACE